MLALITMVRNLKKAWVTWIPVTVFNTGSPITLTSASLHWWSVLKASLSLPHSPVMSDIFLVKQTVIRMSTFCVPGTVLNTLRVWPHLIFTWYSGAGRCWVCWGQGCGFLWVHQRSHHTYTPRLGVQSRALGSSPSSVTNTGWHWQVIWTPSLPFPYQVNKRWEAYDFYCPFEIWIIIAFIEPFKTKSLEKIKCFFFTMKSRLGAQARVPYLLKKCCSNELGGVCVESLQASLLE